MRALDSRGRRVLVAFLVLAVSALPVTAPAGGRRPRLGMYRGLATWVDIFDGNQWDNPERAVQRMANRRVRTLFLETSNFSRDRAILFPAATGRFIEAAHAKGMKIVAWYLPGFKNLRRDLRRSMAAIRFRSPNGQKFNSFGLDIESSIVKNPNRRSDRLIALSKRIRKKVGRRYPLGAIIPSPRGMQLSPTYWPGFPYKRLDRIYNVFVPMGYYTFRTSGAAGARRYTVRNIRIIRNETGRPRVKIHAIGGLAADSSGAETGGFVRAVRRTNILGGSLYDFATSNAADWEQLVRIK